MEQTSKFKQTMFDIASDVGLPESMIQLRHDVIHGEMPSLVALRKASQQALQWLYEQYWRYLDDIRDPLDETANPDAIIEESQSLKVKLKDIARNYVKSCLRSTDQNTDDALRKFLASNACREIANICRDDAKRLPLLVDVLMERKMLLPSRKM